MGFMTEVGILNDRWSEIEADPKKFIEQVKRAAFAGRSEHVHVVGQTTVHPSHHADEPRVYFAERNGFYNLGEYGIEDSLRQHLSCDSHLDFYESKIDKAIGMLKDSKRYVQYLREEVGFDERPRQKDYHPGNDHHIKAWHWRKKKK